MKKITLLLTPLVFTGCLIENDRAFEGVEAKLVVASASPGYTTSDIAIIGNTQDETNVVVEQLVETTNPSDIQIAVHGDDIYRLGRYGFDNITKINWTGETEGLAVDWQYSILGDDLSANPYDLLVVNDSSAYVTRYDATTLWNINPNASSEDALKIAEIDLSAFSRASGGQTYMADLEMVGNYLFVLLTSLGDSWAVVGHSQVAVINLLTNEIVDTNTTQEGVQAIELPVQNASKFDIANGTLIISAVGDAYGTDPASKYSGGVVTLDPINFSTELVIDDGDQDNAPYGSITNATMNSAGDIYFTGSTVYANDQLFVLLSGATEAIEISLGDYQYNITDLAIADDVVYASVHAQYDGSESAGIKVISPLNHQVMSFIEMVYNPNQILVAN